MSDNNTCPQCGKTLSASAPEGFCPACMLRCGLESVTHPTGSSKGRAFTPPTPDELSAYFPGLEIIALLGRGGMGAVYKVRQKQLDRFAALKILPPDVAEDPSFAKRFEREAQALAKLNHANIVTLYEFGKADGLYFFLMEFVDGVNLRQLLNAGRIESIEALAIVPQICDALQFAHDHGIVHRDIKPENLLLDKQGRIKIADFGIAKIVRQPGTDSAGEGGTSSRVSNAPEKPTLGSAAGTPQYMAPEQKEQRDTDHRTDIYSLGVVFYELLTGELPGAKLQPPSRKVQIDVRLDEIVLRALEAKPEHRYQTANAFRTQVETVRSGPDIQNQKRDATPPSSSGKTAPSSFAIIATLLAILVGTAGGFAMFHTATFTQSADIAAGGLGLIAVIAGIGNRSKWPGKIALISGSVIVIVWTILAMLNPNFLFDSQRSESKGVFRCRVFWAGIDAVEKRIPGESRRPVPMMEFNPKVPDWPSQANWPGPWQTAEISTNDLSALLCESSKAPWLLVDENDGFFPWPGRRKHETWRFNRDGEVEGDGCVIGHLGYQRVDEKIQLTTSFMKTGNLDDTDLESIVNWQGNVPASDRARTFFLPFKRKDGSKKFLVIAVEIKTGETPGRSILPKTSRIGYKPAVFLTDDNVDAHYVIFYKGTHFDRGGGVDSSPLNPQKWNESYGIHLESGHTFNYQRDSATPDDLQIDGKHYDLRKGRVFVIKEDGSVENLAMFPTMASNPYAMAQEIAESIALTGGLEKKAGSSSPNSADPAAPRRVVAAFLNGIKAASKGANANLKDVWDLTTRSTSWSGDFAKLPEYDSIRPAHQLGNAEQTMVVSDPFNDDANRPRVFYAVLLKRDGKWLIHDQGYRSPEEVSSLVQGFKLNPGVAFDVQPDELTGVWRFPCASTLTMAADGTGVIIYEGPDGVPEKPKSFRWDVNGSTLRRHWPDQEETLEITWVIDELLRVVHLDGPQKGTSEHFDSRTTGSPKTGTRGAVQ